MSFAQYKLCISSTCGGGGKTLLSLGLGAALTKRGIKVKPYKKGPDYIDTAWLSAACGTAATNLDPFFLERQELISFFKRSFAKSGASFALLEGNRGLYDGLDAHGSYSTATLARMLDFPLLLTLNCAKTTRTIAAIVNGLTAFEKDLHFAGIILNNVGSSRHEQALLQALENSLSLPVLGCLPRLPENPLPERHMGLATTGVELAPHAMQIIKRLANLVNLYCDVDKILQISQVEPASLKTPAATSKPDKFAGHSESRPIIGYPRDASFWFYYPENLEALESKGAKLERISLLESEPYNWQKLSGLYLGGGFPEDYCKELSSSPNLPQIRELAAKGLPIYAECGGVLLLCRSLACQNAVWPMAGVFNFDAIWHKRPVGLGYVEGEVTGNNPFYPRGLKIKGHEFHYSSCTSVDEADYQVKLSRGAGLRKGWDGICTNNTWGSYLHIFAPALPVWSENFVALAYAYQKNH